MVGREVEILRLHLQGKICCTAWQTVADLEQEVAGLAGAESRSGAAIVAEDQMIDGRLVDCGKSDLQREEPEQGPERRLVRILGEDL